MASLESVQAMLAGGPPLWLADTPAQDLPDDVGAVVQTSGSTGLARRVMLPRHALRRAAQATQAFVGRDLTWHLALPSQYVAGLMVLVRNAIAGRPAPHVAADLGDLTPTGDGDAISVVPTQIHRALADPRLRDKLAAMDLVLVGGAALSPELRKRCDDAGLPVVESYGMSETCGGVVWDGVPLPGVAVEIDGDQRLWLRTPTSFSGYLGDPAATSGVLVDGQIRTQDRGRWCDGRLQVMGRIDDVVISGGVNVDLNQVRSCVAAIDTEAVVLAVPDDEWGVRIVVFDHGRDLAWWRHELAAELPRTWLPRQHVRLDDIPRTAGGKPDRQALQELALT